LFYLVVPIIHRGLEVEEKKQIITDVHYEAAEI